MTTTKIEVITKTERRRRWSTAEKIRLVEKTKEPGMSVSLVAREEGVAANMLFRWRRLMEDGALSAVSAEEAVVPSSELRALQQRVRELERCLGRKTLEVEILQEAVEYGKTKKWLVRSPSLPLVDSQ